MELGLAGRTAIVCGASSGMGLAIAETLAAEGANVAMFARRREILEREAERIGALAVQGDLTIPQHLERLVQLQHELHAGLSTGRAFTLQKLGKMERGQTALRGYSGGSPRPAATAIDGRA